MRYFGFDKPIYSSDYHRARMNPAWLQRHEYWLPSLRCSKCGIVSTCTYLVGDVSGEELVEFPELTELTFLPTETWRERAELWSDALHVPSKVLKPSMYIGRPKLEIRGREFQDFLHPFPGWVFVKDQVKDAIIREGFSGVHFVEAISFRKKGKLRDHRPPRLWQVQSTVHVDIKTFRDERLKKCPECGFLLAMPDIEEEPRLVLNPTENADFLRSGEEYYSLNISERVKIFLEAQRFTNVAFRVLPKPILSG